MNIPREIKSEYGKMRKVFVCFDLMVKILARITYKFINNYYGKYSKTNNKVRYISKTNQMTSELI